MQVKKKPLTAPSHCILIRPWPRRASAFWVWIKSNVYMGSGSAQLPSWCSSLCWNLPSTLWWILSTMGTKAMSSSSLLTFLRKSWRTTPIRMVTSGLHFWPLICSLKLMGIDFRKCRSRTIRLIKTWLTPMSPSLLINGLSTSWEISTGQWRSHWNSSHQILRNSERPLLSISCLCSSEKSLELTAKGLDCNKFLIIARRLKWLHVLQVVEGVVEIWTRSAR